MTVDGGATIRSRLLPATMNGGLFVTCILTVTNLYPPHAYGGYEALCEAAVSHWRESGHEVAVLTSEVRRPDQHTDGSDPNVSRTLPMYWRDHRVQHPSLRARFQVERRTRQVVETTLDDLRPDVVSVWNLAALSFGILEYVARRDIPVVAVIGDTWLAFGPQLDAWARLFGRRGALGAAAGRVTRGLTGLATAPPRHLDVTVLFASQYLADHARAHSRFSLARTEVIPHGVDLDAFPLATERPDQPWSGRLLVVSRLDPRKGLATAIRAVADLPDATLQIAGAGDDTHAAELARLCRDLGVADRVQMLGQTSRAEVRELMLAADTVIVPSEWNEPFGIVPLEAMACGAPVIATGTGGSGEFLEDDVTCLRYPAGDPTALRRAVQRLARDPVLRDRLRYEGLQTAARLAEQRTLSTLEAWHVAAATGRGRKP